MWHTARVPRVIEVTDPADPRLDDFRDLSAADRRPDRPGGRGLVIAEGVVVVRRMLASRYRPHALLGVAHRVDDLAADLDAMADNDIAIFVSSPEVMAEVVGFHLNRGVLAVAERVPPSSSAELAADARRLAVLEGVGDHENLGSLFRNAAALGVDGVLLGPRCSDPLYRRSVRVSMGYVLSVPFASIEPWPYGLSWLRDQGFRVLALTPAASAVDVSEVEVAGGRVAVLLGAEGPGLSAEAIHAADAAVRIPMADGVDSLNVATAAAVAFHALRP